MSLKIEIADARVERFDGTSQRTGKPYTKFTQEAYVYIPNQKYPRPFKLEVRDLQGYPIGLYDVDMGQISVGRYGDLQFPRYLNLISIKSSVASLGGK